MSVRRLRPRPTPPAFSLRNVSFAHSSHGKPLVRVFAVFSVAAPGARCVGVVGPSGSGKSTLLDLLAGDRASDDGWVFVGTTPLVRGLVLGMLGAFAAAGFVIGLAATAQVVSLARRGSSDSSGVTTGSRPA